MTERQFNIQRLLRMSLWLIATGASTAWAGLHHTARQTALVPCAFLAIFVPAVLLPLENRTTSKC